MEKEGDSFRLPSLAEGLGPLGERVPPEKAAELAGQSMLSPLQICWVPGNVGARHAVPEVPQSAIFRNCICEMLYLANP